MKNFLTLVENEKKKLKDQRLKKKLFQKYIQGFKALQA